ncbi:MAG: hypothetical protein HKN49_13375 [Gammaproteobacteria bacterium]|nr:hypothetical protein [Gammaproteobacteria bacterium]
MKNLFALFEPFIAIIAHRDGPDRLPASQFLLIIILIAHTLVYALGTHLSGSPARETLLLPLVDLAAQGLFFGLLLALMGLSNRILQTLIASFGVDTLFNFALLPIALAVGSQSDQLPPFLVLSWLVLVIWSIAVKGHILHRATGIPYFAAMVLALGFVIALFKLATSLSGA